MRLKHKRDEEIERRLRGPKLPPLPTALPPEDDRQVDELLSKHGVISKIEREQVTDKDLMRLRPNKWLNDEIINFYGQLILTRSEEGKENFVKNSKKPLDVHYFSTFFWSKLENEGYEKGRLAKWTKKVSPDRGPAVRPQPLIASSHNLGRHLSERRGAHTCQSWQLALDRCCH